MSQLTPHFSLEEFTITEHRNIDNTLPDELMPEAVMTCMVMEDVRKYLSEKKGFEVPITSTSGFRCLELNFEVGSNPTSDHPKARAMDFKAPKFGTPYDICKALEPVMAQLGIGQLIHEYGRWVHVGRSVPSNPVNRVLTYTSSGILVGIRKA